MSQRIIMEIEKELCEYTISKELVFNEHSKLPIHVLTLRYNGLVVNSQGIKQTDKSTNMIDLKIKELEHKIFNLFMNMIDEARQVTEVKA